MGKSSISLSLISALIVLSVLWKPASTNASCDIACKGSPSGPGFLNGHKYNYAVEGVVSIFLTGADKQETSVKLLGQVSVSALGNCAHVLKVQNLIISGPGGKKYGKPPGLEKPVKFSLQDGHVGSEICAEEGDTRRSLNIKRAIISLLQTGQKAGTEVDIFGACPTEASSSQEGGATLLHRFRDLSRCGHREHGKNDLITAVYNPSAEIKNTQILQSSLNVESKLNNGVPEKVSAIEEHLYKPFSVGENGARAKVHTKLTLTGQAGGADNGNCVQSRSIIFENPHGFRAEGSNLQNALNAVKETAKTCATEANSKSAGNFAQLVRIFRTTNQEDLMKVYAQVKGNNLEKRVFLDGLLRAGSSDSIEVSVQLLKTKELTPLEEKLAYLSLGNARHVNNDAVKAVAGLLDIPNLPKEVYLGVGALASAYCRHQNCHTGKSEGIALLSQKLASKLNCKAKGKVEEDYTVAVLKGIRNVRHLEDSIIDKVVHCAADNNVKARVKVAALEAFGADPCAAKVKKTALDLMKNRQLDSEIRIKAYLAVIQCPCGKSANEIKTLLESEPVHQVGRFITSSLRHLRASTNPDKQLARQHYGLIRTPNKFNVDDRKYSFYREVSYNVDALGIAGNSEQTVIYSQDSFLPRSASFNLTAQVFGHSLNVLEVGGRQGNLDRVVEHFLGPKGLLRTEDPQELYDTLLKKFQEAEGKVEGKLTRGRRSVKSDIDNFDKHVKGESTPYDNELDMDIYIKLFGTDAIFLSLGDDKGFDFNNVLDEILKYVDTGINKAKHFQQEIRSHMLFLDAELAYATSTGLPLKLNLIGAATARLEVATNIDIRQILKDPRNAKVDIKFVPSTDIEVSGLFLVDADAVATGLKVVTNLHSSTGGHVVAKVLENGQGFDLQLGLPVDKQEIVTASNDLVYFTTEKGHKEETVALKIDVDRKEYAFCFDQMAGVLGLTLCGDVSVPFSVSGPEAQASLQKFIARYPLTGTAKVKLSLEKNDLKGYHIKGIVRTQPNKNSFEILFEAEGSKNRKTALSGEYINNQEEKTVSLTLDSPIKVLSGQVSLFTKRSEYAVLVKAKMDAEEYFGRAGFNVQGSDKRQIFKPALEYSVPGGQGKKSLKIDGQVVREVDGPTTKYSLDGIKINMPSNEVIDINGKVAIKGRDFESDIKAKKGEHNLLISASLKGHDGKLEFQNTLNPYINFKVVGHSEFEDKNVRNDIDLYYGGDLKNKQNRVTFNQLLKYHKKSLENFGFITKNKFQIHALPILVKVDAEVDPKKVDIELEGQYVDKKANFDLEARTQIKKQGDYSVKLDASVDKYGIDILAKRDIVSADKSNFENHIDLKGIAKYELSGVVLHKTKPNDLNIGAIGHLKATGGGETDDIKFDIGAIENANLYTSHAKISRNKGELVDFLLKINRGANPNGQLKVVLKDAIAANGQFKVTDADGKGNGMIIVDFKTAQRKIKGDVKFVVKEPAYSADVDLFLNFEKDNADKIHFSTNTKKTEKLVDSKNKIVYAGKKFEVNLHKDGIIENVGKCSANLEVVLPTERVLSLNVNREMVTQDNTLNGQIEAVASDAIKRGGPASTLTYKAKLSNTNIEKDTINYEGQILLKLKDGKNLDNTFSVKNTPQGNDKLKYEFKSDVTGSLIPKPASLVVNYDYVDPEKSLVDGQEKYRVKGTYGSDIGFEIDQTSDVNLLEKGDKKFHADTTVLVRLPLEKAHDIKIVSNILYLMPQNNDVVLEYTVSESVQINADLYKVDASGKLGPKVGQNKVKVLVPHVDPFSLDASYKVDVEGVKKHGTFDVKTTYGKGKTATIVAAATSADHEYSLNIKANAPQAEQLKKLELNLVTKTPGVDSYSSSMIVDADGRVYKSDLVVVYSKAHPLIDIKYSSPSNKQSRIFVKGSALSSNQGKLELKLENIKDLSLDASSEGTIQKDHVVLKLAATSEKFGLKNYKVDISSKDAGSGKRLEFFATNDNKNVFSGSTSFISKQEGPKTIIEGSGSVKVKDDQKSATFKYIRTLLTEGSEQGVETFMNVAIGDRSYVAESRVTNLEYKTSYVYCEEKKQCAHAELNSKVSVPKQGVLEHKVNVGLDLRKLGFAPEFGLEAKSEVSQHRLPQYTMDVHVNKEERKYHLHVYSQPEHGKYPAGITITLPQRVLALESLLTYPANQGLPFPIKGDISLNLDKNKPQLKSAIRMLVDLTGAEKQHGVIAEFGFSHPKLGKEVTAKFRGNLQRPSDNAVKIESSAIISHSTLGGDREAKFLLEASPIHIKVYLDTPIVKVIDLVGSATLKDNLQQGDLKFALLQGKSVQVKAIAKDFQYFEFTTGYSEEQQRKLSIIGHIDPEKRVDISADIILPNEKKNIIHGALFLQDNLVKSDYGISKPNFNYFVNALQKDLSSLADRVKQLGEKTSAELKNTLSKVEPTLKQLEQSYEEEIKKLVHEFSNDKVLKEISDALDDVVRYFATMIEEIIKVTKPIVDKIQSTVAETCKKIKELYEKQIEGQVKELYQNVAAVIQESLEGLIDLVAHFAAIVTDFFEKHKPELQELTNTIAEIFKDLTRLVVTQMKEFRSRVAQILSEVTQQIKDMPLVAMIKERVQELAVPEQFVGVLTQMHQAIRVILPTEETKAFADSVATYASKKLRQEKVDDSAELRKIYEKFTVALTSVIQFVRQQLNQVGVPSLINLNVFPVVSSPGQSMPSISSVPTFSLLNQLLHGDLPDPLSLIKAYRPRSVNPLDEVPNKLRAVVVNGQHIFTFDGRHLTFPGSCRYVLAHDYVDRNFTLIIQLQNGAPKALLLEDKSGTTVELRENGQVAVNGAAHGFPVHEKDIFAFRETNGRIGVGTTYGLLARCTAKLTVCYIEASGFYLGKLRGLLGDGNNEPYDDFRLPNGKIVTSEAEFGNTYRLSSSCAQVKTPEHSAHQHHAALPAACEKVFGSSSTLRPLALVLDAAPFRQACIHACTGDVTDALQQACDLARGYTALAVTGLLPAMLPSVCVQCTDADKPRNVGDTYHVKLPGKKADVVVSVETTKVNEKTYKDLVVPLISQVVDGLKGKHIDDIKVYLVGITSKMPYPILYDADNKLKGAKIKFDDESRYQPTQTIKTGQQKVDNAERILADIIDEVRTKLGLYNIFAGYHSLLDLPLRAGAVKHFVSVVGEKCKDQLIFLEFARIISYGVITEQNAITMSAIINTPNIKIGNGKNPSDIIGFDSESVLLLGDKKRGKDSSALRQTVETEDDACIFFHQSTEGLVLSSSNYAAMNPGQQKQFLHAASAKIVEGMLHYNLEQECTCAFVDPFRVRSVCINEEKKEAARRRK